MEYTITDVHTGDRLAGPMPASRVSSYLSARNLIPTGAEDGALYVEKILPGELSKVVAFPYRVG